MRSKTNSYERVRAQKAIVTCPDCGEKLVLRGILQVGLQICCENCEAELEVVNMAPVEVDWVSLEPSDQGDLLGRR